MEAAIAELDADLRQLAHASAQRQARILDAPVIVDAARVLDELAGPHYVGTIARNDVLHYFSL